jgi:hypothetical protein
MDESVHGSWPIQEFAMNHELSATLLSPMYPFHFAIILYHYSFVLQVFFPALVNINITGIFFSQADEGGIVCGFAHHQLIIKGG